MENKPKIDLKARLGKKTVSGRMGGPSIPPPVGLRPGGIGGGPAVGGPPAGIGSSPSQPPLDPSNPYSAISAAQAPVVEPKAIKIEMSEEVVQAQKKGRSKVMILAGVTAVIGMIIGFAIGGLNENSKRHETALAGAKTLAKEIDDAGIQGQALADVLKAIGKQLGDGKYPEEDVNKLGGIDIPFDGANLSGKAIGLFKPQLTVGLLQYAGIAAQVDEQKDKIRRLLVASKSVLSDLLAEKDAPKVRWSVFIQPGPFGPWANMQPVPEPFLVKSEEKGYKWPDDMKIKDGDQTVTLKRYNKGDVSSPSGDTPDFIPVVPQTQSLVCPSDTVIRLRREVSAMEELLNGDETPGQEKAGLLPLGQQVVEELKKIGTAG